MRIVAQIVALDLLLLSLTSSAADRPNILWIVAEDMSPTLGCYGDKYATTPNIDRLAEASVRYTHAFATAPVCSPSRSCLITGCYATTLGTHQMRSAFPIPELIRGFPAYLREAGYYTSNNFKTDYNTSSATRIIRESWDESSSKAHWRNRDDKAKPFFSVFNIMTSHQSRSMVYTQTRFRDEVQSKISQAAIHDPDNAPIPTYYPDTLVTRRIVARYYDCVTAMDQQVGQILRELEEDGLAEDTIVFFYSDHGSGMPRHKRLLTDSGMHVPLLVKFPEKYAHLSPGAAGSTTDRLVSFVDFPPTVLRLLGLEPPKYMQGRAFLGPDANPASEREYVYGHRDRIDEVVDLSRSVRDKRYLYIRNFMPHRSWNQYSAYSDLSEIRHEFYRAAESNDMPTALSHYAGSVRPHEELYDCENDPQNTVNLAKTPEHAETLKRLRNELMRNARKQRDLGFLPEINAQQRYKGTTPWEKSMSQLDNASNELLTAFASTDFFSPTGWPNQWLFSEEPTLRYWAAVGLQSAPDLSPVQRATLRQGLSDPSPVVRIEFASTLCQHGDIKIGLPILVQELESDDLTVVLYATRAIELLGQAAKSAIPAIEKVAARAEKLQAATTGAVFDQSGDKDLAMFCSFSANGFLTRLKQGPWKELIQPQSLRGWNGTNDSVRSGEDREITMLSKGKNLWIVHDEQFDNFELSAEVLMPTDNYNAGIGFRCQTTGNGKPKGYQCEVADQESGMLYAIASGGWVYPKGDKQRATFFEQVGSAFRSGHWNHFRIRCVGSKIQIWVNGILTTDIEDKRHTSGHIALQHHGKGGIHHYRNVRVRRLEP